MKIAYNCCQLDNHEQQFLFDICIDANCKSEQKLLCGFCKEDHIDCRHTSLKKFLLEFQYQFKKYQQEEEEYYSQYSLNKTFADMEFQTLRAKQNICSQFDQLLSSLREAQKKLQTFKDPNYEEMSKILGSIPTSENMITEIGTLTKQIENLAPSDGNSFTLKKPIKRVLDMKERQKESEKIVKDYIEFNDQYFSEFQDQIKLIRDQIEKLCDSDSKSKSKQLSNQSPKFKFLEEQKEKVLFTSSSLKELDNKDSIHLVDPNVFSLLQNPIPKKQLENHQSKIESDYAFQLEPVSSNSPHYDETKENENLTKIKDVEISLGEFQNAGQTILKTFFIDNENVFFVFNDGKGLHYNVKLKTLGHFNSELGSTINDVTYSSFTKHMSFGTKHGVLHIFEFNLSNQAERPLIQKNALRLESSPILFVQASHHDNLVYTLSSTKNLKVVNTVVQNSVLTKYHPPQSLDKPVAIIRYLEKNQVWICGETGFFVYEADNGRGKYYSLEDRSDRASGYYVKGNFLYIVCQKYILVKLASSFQTYNKNLFDNTIRASNFLPQLDIFIVSLYKSSGKYQTWVQPMNKGCGGKKEKIDDDEWNFIVPSCPQYQPLAIVAKITGTFRIMNFNEKKRI